MACLRVPADAALEIPCGTVPLPTTSLLYISIAVCQVPIADSLILQGIQGKFHPDLHCAEAAKDMKNTTALLGRLLSSGGLCTGGLCGWFSCFLTLKAV